MNKYVWVLVAGCFVSGCSPVMEANRPDPVDINQFTIGENRMNVLGVIGSPLGTTTDRGNSCDMYKLYTDGPNSTGKGAIAASEAVVDVFTLGLAEIVFTPVEAGTKSDKHSVIFCYSKDDMLVSINKTDTPAGED